MRGILPALGLAAACCGDGQPSSPGTSQNAPDTIVPVVLDTLPHDPEAFTQGLEVSGGVLFESTGLYGRSDVRAMDPATGELLLSADLPDTLFGEGLTVMGDMLLQLTWRSGRVLAWSRGLDPLESPYGISGEGWGICHMPESSLVATSDGSAYLQLRSETDLSPVRSLLVTAGGMPRGSLNELEWQGGLLWANVWGTRTILAIDPADGNVVSVADCSALQPPSGEVMNGIAWDPEREAFLLTGKLWPVIYVVEMVPGGY